MSFSKRNGIEKEEELQINSMSDSLRMRLWNVLYTIVVEGILRFGGHEMPSYSNFIKWLWHGFYGLPVDEISDYEPDSFSYIKKHILIDKWHKVYDFFEFLLKMEMESKIRSAFVNSINHSLEKENSAYRIADNLIVPVSSDFDLKTISDAVELTKTESNLKGAYIHLEKSLKFLSAKQNPDFSNSIKESISAVETVCRLYTGESTLGKALKKLSSKGVQIHPDLTKALEKLYVFTNNKDSGIRHALLSDYKKPDLYDATYLLCICSAFVSYIVGKKSKAVD